MRILYFSYVDFDWPNACQTHTLGVLAGFSHHGLHVEAVVPRPKLHLPPYPGLTYHFSFPYRGGRRYLPGQVVATTLLMLRLCLSHTFDAIYARDMDVFVGPRLCSRFFNLPLFLEIDDTPVEGRYPAPLRKLVELNLKQDYRRASGFIVPSVPRTRILVDRYEVPEHKVHVVLNGAEEPKGRPLAPQQAKAKLGLPPDSFCLGYVGYINDRYDFSSILAALAQSQPSVPGIRFIIVGDGPCYAQLQRQVRQLRLEHEVIFTGFIQPEKLIDIVPAMDVGMMNLTTAAAAEHGPIHTKMSTYGLFGLPVITAGSSLAGYPEEIKQGVFLIPPENPDALADLIIKLYQQPQLRQTKAAALQQYVREKLTWNAVTADIIDIITHAKVPPDFSEIRPL